MTQETRGADTVVRGGPFTSEETGWVDDCIHRFPDHHTMQLFDAVGAALHGKTRRLGDIKQPEGPHGGHWFLRHRGTHWPFVIPFVIKEVTFEGRLPQAHEPYNVLLYVQGEGFDDALIAHACRTFGQAYLAMHWMLKSNVLLRPTQRVLHPKPEEVKKFTI